MLCLKPIIVFCSILDLRSGFYCMDFALSTLLSDAIRLLARERLELGQVVGSWSSLQERASAMSDADGDAEAGSPTRAIATSSAPRQTTLNGDASNSSQINASSIHQSSSAGTGSLPRQYPGRTYYYRARAPSTSAGNQAAMSLTQSHFDIREGECWAVISVSRVL